MLLFQTPGEETTQAATSIIDALKNQGYAMLEVIPALIKAGAIMLVGWLIAKLLAAAIRRLLSAIGADKLAEKLMQIDFFRKSKIKLVPSKVISGVIYYFIVIIFAMASIEAIGLQMLSELLQDFIAYIPNGITAFALLLLGIFLADAIKRLIVTTCKTLGIASGNLIANVIFYFILLNVILIALRQAKLQTEFMEENISIILAGVAGAFAIGYGFASRDIMSSLLASFYSRGRIKVGDEVTVNGMRGEIVTINNNDLILRAEDSEYVVPFSLVSKGGVEVHSRREVGPALPPNRAGEKEN